MRKEFSSQCISYKDFNFNFGEKSCFTNDPTFKNSSFASAANTDGSQSIRLIVKSNRTAGQESGIYKDAYTVVFVLK